MRIIFFILTTFVLAAVPSIAQSQVQYTVSGTFAKNGNTVYLLDQLTEKKIDSVVVADGKFSFTGTADKDALMAVKAKKSRCYKLEKDFSVITKQNSGATDKPSGEMVYGC